MGGDEWKAAQHARCEVRAMRERAGLSGEQLTASGVSDEEAVEYLKLMHQRLGHTSLRYLRQMYRSGAIWGPEISDSQFNDVQFYCPVCDRTRQTRKPDARKSKRPKKEFKILEAVGTDVIPLKVTSLKTRGPRGRLGGGGNKYAIPFVDMETKRIFMAFTDRKDKLERKVMEAKDAMEMCAALQVFGFRENYQRLADFHSLCSSSEGALLVAMFPVGRAAHWSVTPLVTGGPRE